MKLDYDFSFDIGLKNIFEGEGYEKLKRSLFSILLRQKDLLFVNEQDPDGNKWESLSKATLARRKKGKKTQYSEKILQDTGKLKNSLTNAQAPYSVGSTTGNEVIIGTNVEYAAIQNYGGNVTLPPVEITNGFGKGLHFTIPERTITIKPRPFIGFGKNDDEEVTEKIEAYMAKGAP